MEYKPVIILAIILNACHDIDAKLNVIPRNTDVMVNDSTYLNCSTSLQANQVHWHHDTNYVYTAIGIFEQYTERFSVEINASSGTCNLVIRSVQTSDAGTYKCSEDEGHGEQKSVQLIVLDNDPACKSNIHLDGVIGPNSCGIEPEEVKLSCSIKYHGNTFPVLQWNANGNNKSITDGLVDITSIYNEVTYTLTMKSTLDRNNSSFICLTTRTTDKPYNCSSDAINILYVFGSEVAVNMTINDEVSCFANSSQSCSYKWKWFNGDDSTTESDNQNLIPKKGGMHRCEATCPIRNESCAVQSMRATVYVEETPYGQSRMALLALLLVPLFAVIGVSMWYWRKRNEREEKDRKIGEEVEQQIREEVERQVREEVEQQKLEEEERQKALEVERRRLEEIERQRQEVEERRKLLGLIATIRNKAAEEMQKTIAGLTILDNELFVVSDKSSEVEVYDSMNFSFSRQLTLKELIDAYDIVSCNRNKCLYISDLKVGGLSKEIFRVDPSGKLIKRWSTKNDSGQLSVTYDSNVILIAYRGNKLNEYSPGGQLIREIHLSSEEGFCHPWHAIKLTNGHFVVSHGRYDDDDDDDDDDLHRVCIVDADGKLLKSFGGKRGSTIEQTHGPVYLSVDGSGSVMVADCHNDRVLLMDSNLELNKEILTEEHGLGGPYSILLDDSNSRLFVSDNYQKNSRIMIFNLVLVRQTRNDTLNS